jgi:RHS repeat-associated protein
MNQYGFKVNGSALIDQLIYTYQTNSNKLSKVNDVVNDPLSKLGDFHYSGTKQATDYSYDGNGNLISDNNKAISGIVYNYLNLPQNVTVTAKGSITYTYDAGGNKLAKTTVDNTVVPSKTTTTLYMGGFIYQNDTLQFISHEEGRARWAFHRYLNGSTNYKWEYDYFLKDHLGNTRMVLTQEKDTSQYIATMEAAYRATENRLFYNIPATSYARSAVSGYPTDNTTVPNDSLARVNGNGPKTGPSILLKVMSGDVIDVATKSFYKSGGTVNSPNSILTDVLNSLAGGIVTATSASHGVVSDLTNTSTSPIYAALNSFLPTNDPNTTGKPKAYLNWILLNDQFQGVNTYPQSGAIPVGGADVLNTLAYTGIPITKNGYLYIWVSNETPGWDVFFDNLSVKQYSGAITEETHYYPFGLSMAGISDKALNNSPENKYKYNKGSELQNKEFSDGSGLELYSTFYRSLDPQLGRFWQIDPKPNPEFSLYAAMQNNPISFNDVLGDSIIGKANNAIANRIVTKATNQMTKNANTINDNNKKIDAAKAKIAAGATGKDLKKANSAMNSLNKKNDELQNRNDRLNTGINAIGKMRADVDHNYSFTSPANDDGTHHVTQGEGKNVLVEGSNDGLFFHESVHVLQSLNTGGLNFSTNESTKGYLLNDASTGTYIGDEVQAYQVEFSYDGSFSNSNASNLNDINNDSVRGLHDGDYYPYQNLK